MTPVVLVVDEVAQLWDTPPTAEQARLAAVLARVLATGRTAHVAVVLSTPTRQNPASPRRTR